MADATVVVADATPKKVDTDSGVTDKPKMWSDDDVKVIIAERDKAKEKARKYDEEKKKTEDLKAIEEGRSKEVFAVMGKELEDSRAKVKAFEERDAKERGELLATIKDDDEKAIAAGLTDISLIRKFVERSEQGGPSEGKHSRVSPQDTSPFKKLEKETYPEYQRRIQALKAGHAKK